MLRSLEESDNMGRPQMKRAELYACLYAKEFPAQALLRLRPDLRSKPCVVMEGEPPMQVCSLNRMASRLGIVRGMTRVEVDTFSSAELLSRSAKEETATKTAILQCVGGFSPRMEDRSEDCALLCVIDIAGTEKLFGPPEILAHSILNQVRALGVATCFTISSNFHTAVCLAKGSSPSSKVKIVPEGEESAALTSLPLTVLDLTTEQAETFSFWGISTLEMLAALPEKELISRMGQEGKRLRQLARGELSHFFQPIEPKFALEEHMELDSPLELLDSLLFVVAVMLDQLILRTKAHMLALASVTLTLTLEESATHTRTVRAVLPTNDKQLWIKLLHLDLEAHPPLAAILSLSVTAEPGSTSKVQLGLFSPQLPEPMRLDVTLARIRAIVGEECAGRAVLQDTHQPNGFHMEPFTVPASTAACPVAPDRSRSALRQLRPPQDISVSAQGQRPKAFVFRERYYVVENIYGPWLIDGDWWNPTLWKLEQWDVVARAQENTLLCCCLVHDLRQDCWQMVALYD
jgi:protein ImuB